MTPDQQVPGSSQCDREPEPRLPLSAPVLLQVSWGRSLRAATRHQEFLRISLMSASFGQHYPLYRASDANCSGEDAAPPEERNVPFEEKYDVLSREASQKVCGDVTSCQCHMGTANGHREPLWSPAAERGRL